MRVSNCDLKCDSKYAEKKTVWAMVTSITCWKDYDVTPVEQFKQIAIQNFKKKLFQKN